MDDSKICYVSVAQTGVIVQQKKLLFFYGLKLYEGDNLRLIAEKAMHLDGKYPDDLTPYDMVNPVLKAFTNAVLHCKNLAEVTRILNAT